MAKEKLKTQGKGYIVEAIENHYDLKSYITSFKDSSNFSKAYVDDLLECLDITLKENHRLMNEFDLGDCLD